MWDLQGICKCLPICVGLVSSDVNQLAEGLGFPRKSIPSRGLPSILEECVRGALSVGGVQGDSGLSAIFRVGIAMPSVALDYTQWSGPIDYTWQISIQHGSLHHTNHHWQRSPWNQFIIIWHRRRATLINIALGLCSKTLENEFLVKAQWNFDMDAQAWRVPGRETVLTGWLICVDTDLICITNRYIWALLVSECLLLIMSLKFFSIFELGWLQFYA